MDPLIRIGQIGAPDFEILVAAVTSLMSLLIVRFTSPKRVREMRKTRIIKRLLAELDKIESKDAKLTERSP